MMENLKRPSVYRISSEKRRLVHSIIVQEGLPTLPEIRVNPCFSDSVFYGLETFYGTLDRIPGLSQSLKLLFVEPGVSEVGLDFR